MRGPVTVGGPPVTAAHPTSPRQASASPRRRCTHSLNHPSASYSFDRSLPFVPAKRPRNGTAEAFVPCRPSRCARACSALLCSRRAADGDGHAARARVRQRLQRLAYPFFAAKASAGRRAGRGTDRQAPLTREGILGRATGGRVRFRRAPSGGKATLSACSYRSFFPSWDKPVPPNPKSKISTSTPPPPPPSPRTASTSHCN